MPPSNGPTRSWADVAAGRKLTTPEASGSVPILPAGSTEEKQLPELEAQNISHENAVETGKDTCDASSNASAAVSSSLALPASPALSQSIPVDEKDIELGSTTDHSETKFATSEDLKSDATPVDTQAIARDAGSNSDSEPCADEIHNSSSEQDGVYTSDASVCPASPVTVEPSTKSPEVNGKDESTVEATKDDNAPEGDASQPSKKKKNKKQKKSKKKRGLKKKNKRGTKTLAAPTVPLNPLASAYTPVHMPIQQPIRASKPLSAAATPFVSRMSRAIVLPTEPSVCQETIACDSAELSEGCVQTFELERRAPILLADHKLRRTRSFSSLTGRDVFLDKSQMQDDIVELAMIVPQLDLLDCK